MLWAEASKQSIESSESVSLNEVGAAMPSRGTPQKQKRARGGGVPSPKGQSPPKRQFAQRGIQQKAFPDPPPTR